MAFTCVHEGATIKDPSMLYNTKFYVTTPIYYVTANPHLGTLYTTVMADVIARWRALLGDHVFFLTGTDEHGQKIAQAARDAAQEPRAFVDRMSQAYKDMWRMYDLDYSHFIRTTDECHTRGVHAWISAAQEKGDIYKARYEGWYCVPDETFVTEKEASVGRADGPLCPSCGRQTVPLSEENYFFRLSAYADRLLDFYRRNPDFITPKERLNEVVSFVESGLKDISISRTGLTWGIPFAGDNAHTVYVWVDALMNYATAVGYGTPEKGATFTYWWPPDVHIMAKEIVKFHATYWPAFLMSADLPLPRRMLVHGWVLVDGQKMSKSRGNVVDPRELYEKYGADAVRYYLLRHLPINQDGDFSYVTLEEHINADLVGGLGNLLNRVCTLALNNGANTLERPERLSPESQAREAHARELIADYTKHLDDYCFHTGLARLWKFVNQTNAYFQSQKPWALASSDPQAFREVLWATCNSLKTMAVLAWPFMPHKMEELMASLGVPFKKPDGTRRCGGLDLASWDVHFSLSKIPPLFAKAGTYKEATDAAAAEKVVEKKGKGPAPEPRTPSSLATPQPDGSLVDIEAFAAIELLVGTIEDVHPVPGSHKLLELTVNFGQRGTRTILAGIGPWYGGEELRATQAVFVYNLKPRTIVGRTSQGMLMCAQDAAGKPTIVRPAGPIPDGTRLR